MRFAIVNDERTSPSPGLIGACPVCGQETISKCGNERVHHWAHRARRMCDRWWEPETEWHRDWKDKFPFEWQERILFDTAGEKHIADVRTPHGVTIEFQYSHLNPEERSCRETAYGNMIWVVSGARLARDLPRFLERAPTFRMISPSGLHLCDFPEEVFSKKWLNSTMPVVFDFRDASGAENADSIAEHLLWCLLPGRVFRQAILWAIKPDEFVHRCQELAAPIPFQRIVAKIAEALAIQEQRRAIEARSISMPLSMRHVASRQQIWRRLRRFRRGSRWR